MLTLFELLDPYLLSASQFCCSSIAVFIQIQGCLICLTLALGWALAAYITSLYGGPLEFLFVVESTEDPAYEAVCMLLENFNDDIETHIVVAGLSTTCSQKIHNQLVGVEKMHKDTKYVLFLDDDVRLHPGSIGALTAEMEKNPDPCSMGFATGGKTFFLWGGCMMMHADDFRNDLYGIVTGLRDGGYSDDMTLAAIAGQHKRLITSPPVAVFPHPLASDLSFPRYWNYLRKQTFVLESYIDRVNWIMNRALFTVHFYLSWGFVAPYIMAMIHTAAALRGYFRGYSFDGTSTTGGLVLVGCLAICTFIELLSMWNLTKVEIQLCNDLSPEGPPVSLGSYNWVLIFLAMLVDNFLYPISAIKSHFGQSINWSGVRYHLRNGKISKIDRKKESAFKYSDLAGKYLYGYKGARHASFISYLTGGLVRRHQHKKSED
ncbi:hypothetical protein MKX01_035617 [Papaver californicum]|nr:hypothetical protein MKX01_035617 [Papaver californicum]